MAQQSGRRSNGVGPAKRFTPPRSQLVATGRGGFTEAFNGNVTRLPRIRKESVGKRFLGVYPLPQNATKTFFNVGRSPMTGFGMRGGAIKAMGMGPRYIPWRGVKIGAGFF